MMAQDELGNFSKGGTSNPMFLGDLGKNPDEDARARGSGLSWAFPADGCQGYTPLEG